MDVVTSLVGDLDPPDTVPRRRPSRGDAAAAAAASQLPSLPEADSPAAPPPQQHATHAGAAFLAQKHSLSWSSNLGTVCWPVSSVNNQVGLGF